MARREAAHKRLLRRRQSQSGYGKEGEKKLKRQQTSVHPTVVHQRVGTDAADVDDFIVSFTHGPLGLHLEEIHDCNYGAFVAETQVGSQAGISRLQVGDILIKIKSQSMEDVSFDDAVQILMATGRPLNLTFRRRLKVFCDHAEGLDGAGHMHGCVYSFDAGLGNLGFALEEMSNSTLNGVRYDLCVTDIGGHGAAAEKGLKSLDILVGLNGDSVGGLGFEETRDLLVKSPRPMSMHFFRFGEGKATIEMGTDYLHEEVIFVLQYVALATQRRFDRKADLSKMTRKDELKVKSLQGARHNLNKLKNRLVSLLDEGVLHTDRDSCVDLLSQIRSCITELDITQAAVDAIGAAKIDKIEKEKKKKKKKKKGK